MVVNGLQKLTLLDFPGHTACTVFLGGCNFRCPFCHNASLVLAPRTQPEIPEEELFSFLQKRKGLLDGVAVTGGEPTLRKDLPEFLRRLKDLGYAVKLDSNGTNPAMLRGLAEQGLVDYVAMDIKAGPANYGKLTGLRAPDLSPVRESAAFLMEGSLPFEFRTTLVKELHSEEDMHAIGAWLRGGERYFLQSFKDSGDVIGEGFSAFSAPELEGLLAIARTYVPHTELRGID